MGSVRGRVTVCLTALWLTLPAAAFASTCYAPDETIESAREVLLRLSAKPVALTLFALAGFALYSRKRLPFALAGAFWGVLAFVIAVDNHELFFDDKNVLGIIQDCTASPHLFIALAIAICAGMTYGALRPRT
ncbi:hypothetical protein [Leisingera aquaemixtae]|uniref:Uncharacterized protein n=1 Tax=Leisingera aquaemixtae TaxID=1396826 RepID=A0A0P1HKA7_9RHOB|nr:hypothetical protein [Leisingera aquaemixtae]CUH98880.1 hypothetical protein PHA8399_00996 [Leisingera aquaemixtae]